MIFLRYWRTILAFPALLLPALVLASTVDKSRCVGRSDAHDGHGVNEEDVVCLQSATELTPELHKCTVEDIQRRTADLVTRCVDRHCIQMLYKVAIQKMWEQPDVNTAGGQCPNSIAEALYSDAKKIKDPLTGTTVIQWPDQWSTPTFYFPEYPSTSNGVWDCSTLGSLPRTLRESRDTILQELRANADEDWNTAFDYFNEPRWSKIVLYQKGEWSHTDHFPKLIELLQKYLPSTSTPAFAEKKIDPFEEVMFLRIMPHVKVPPHCGRSNLQINVHLTLSGDTTTLWLKDKEFSLKAGDMICFQDSAKHEVQNGSQVREALVIRLAHPDTTIGREKEYEEL